LPDADEAAAMFAFRHWRDDSGRALREAWAGIDAARPACPVLCIASDGDEDVPPAATIAFADAWQASLLRVPGSHVGPLLGRRAARIAADVLGWLSER
jgi:pimeloyl-ACP methyl ester carboxylesterase